MDDAVMRWVENVLGTEVVDVRGLRDGGSPWLVTHGSGSVVVRTGAAPDRDLFDIEAAALGLLAEHDAVPAPRLLAFSPAPLAMMIERFPGSSRIPDTAPEARLRTLGAAVVALQSITPFTRPAGKPAGTPGGAPATAPGGARVTAPGGAPDAGPGGGPDGLLLPWRTRPISGVDFAALRREAPPQPLLAAAEARIAAVPVPGTFSGLVHGDLWQGNALWDGATLTGLVDWDCAGVGPAGVDLGSLRCDAALCYGPGAAAHVLAGYEEAAGHAARDVAYWDAVAALSTPPDMSWFVGAQHGQGRTDLTRTLMVDRRDAFLEAALAAL